MIINIASFGGRTHMLDLARELEKQGNIVRFYSYVPTKRALKFGLKKECSYSIFYWMLPFLLIFKCFGFGGWREELYNRFCDFFIAYYMKPCDIFIGQSPMHNYSIRYAKRKHNAITILERGTIHILEYENIMNCIKKIKVHSKSAIKRDLKGYYYPDYISVGSEQVKDTFVKNNISSSKIFVNNYGFNISQFRPTELSQKHFDLLFVGKWSILKGCKLIIELCKKRTDLTFLHVGTITDLNFPSNMPNMKHIDAVQEDQLINYYSVAKIFILPSYIEGLALVLMQAAACGLPIVCSKQTGGRDLWKYTNSKEWVTEITDHSIEEINNAINKALLLSKKQTGIRNYLSNNFQESSWDGYGKRYQNFLQKITQQDTIS